MAKNKKTSRSRSSNAKKGEKKPYLVFVSHATHDKWIATVLCEKIEDTGAVTFRDDRDIEGGEKIPSVIKEKINSCNDFVVLLTPESIKRQWVLIEIGMACATNRRIVPLMYHVDGGQIPDIIKDDKGFTLNELDRYLSEVTERVAKR